MLCKNCNYTFTNPQPANNRCRCGLILDGAGVVTGKTAHGNPGKRPVRPAKSPEGLYDNVGNCLAKLIPEWAVGSKKGCKCKDIQAKLNRWGTKGCEDNIEWIVTKMVGQKKYLRGALKMVPDGVAEGGVRWLVNKAIKMSKEK